LDGSFELQMFASEVLGDFDLFGDDACGMPVSLQIERLKSALSGRTAEGVSIASVEMGDLDDTERHAVIDLIVAGEESPYVLLDGRVVSTAGVHVDKVLEALV
jgi:hypothetical protein